MSNPPSDGEKVAVDVHDPEEEERQASLDASSTHREEELPDDADAEVAATFEAAGNSDDMAERGEGSHGEEEEEEEEDGGDDDLPDNVSSDVRPAPAVAVTYEVFGISRDATTEPHAHEESAETLGAEGEPRVRLAGSQTDPAETTTGVVDETEAAMTAEALQAMNPSQGTQADAAVDAVAAPDTAAGEHPPLPTEREGEDGATETDHAEQDEDGEEESGALQEEVHASSHKEETTTPAPVPVPQAMVGTVTVNATLLPMNCRTHLMLPVTRATMNAHLTGQALFGGEGIPEGAGCWVLSARALFEAIASRLCVHPQSFHLLRNGERIHFQHSIVLEVDRTSVAEAAKPGGSADPYPGTTAAAAAVFAAAAEIGMHVGYNRAEPLWLSLVFPQGSATTTAEAEGVAAENDAPSERRGDGVPSHLADLHPGEILERCIHARKEKPTLLPQTLVEGRRQGLSFDETIRQSYAYDRGVAGDEDVTAVVAITRATDAAKKPFIGGYRVKEDPSRLLFHASTQLFMKDLSYSPFPDKKVKSTETCSRQTQTYGISRSCQTARECGVQTPSFMDGGHITLDTSQDYVMVARPYFSAAQLHKLRVEKVITLQKMYRQWKARQIRRGLEEQEANKQQRAEERQRAEEAAQRARENRAHLRRADPRTTADFDRLREEVMYWRSTEAERLARDPHLTQRERQNALLAITNEEVRMLQELEYRRRLTLLERKDQQFSSQLARTAADKVWGTSGVHVTTPETVRAGELRDLYANLLNHAGRSLEERLDVLLHVKWTVKEFPKAPVAAELAQLIDREADLLHRGRREASLTGLRKRIELLFRQFLEDPAYNPGMAPFTTTAMGRAKVRELGLDTKTSATNTARNGLSMSTAGNMTVSSSTGAVPVPVGDDGVPYGGYTAAKCASCSQQLRTATLVQGRRARQRVATTQSGVGEGDEETSLGMTGGDGDGLYYGDLEGSVKGRSGSSRVGERNALVAASYPTAAKAVL